MVQSAENGKGKEQTEDSQPLVIDSQAREAQGSSCHVSPLARNPPDHSANATKNEDPDSEDEDISNPNGKRAGFEPCWWPGARNMGLKLELGKAEQETRRSSADSLWIGGDEEEDKIEGKSPGKVDFEDKLKTKPKKSTKPKLKASKKPAASRSSYKSVSGADLDMSSSTMFALSLAPKEKKRWSSSDASKCVVS